MEPHQPAHPEHPNKSPSTPSGATPPESPPLAELEIPKPVHLVQGITIESGEFLVQRRFGDLIKEAAARNFSIVDPTLAEYLAECISPYALTLIPCPPPQIIDPFAEAPIQSIEDVYMFFMGNEEAILYCEEAILYCEEAWSTTQAIGNAALVTQCSPHRCDVPPFNTLVDVNGWRFGETAFAVLAECSGFPPRMRELFDFISDRFERCRDCINEAGDRLLQGI